MQLKHADPSDLQALRQALSLADPQNKLKPIEMDSISIGPNALDLLPEIVAALSNRKKTLLVMDSTPILRNGVNCKERLLELFTGQEVACLVLTDNPLHADEKNAETIIAALKGVYCVVAVGSGTICDLCKDASSRVTPLVPMVMVQTALSVNAFSDGVAVVLRNGVKRTLPARYPNVLLVDMQIVQEAPHDMNLAGFGDLAATWTAPADWSLANRLGMTDAYHDAPGDLLREQTAMLFEQGAALAARDTAAMDRLAKVLTLSGLAMGVAGESSPCSGTEHIISHMLDMSAKDRPLAYHGQQVSISAILTAIAWDILFDELEAENISVCFPQEETMRQMVYEAFKPLGSETAAECWADYQKKLALWHEKEATVRDFFAHWAQHKSELKTLFARPQVVSGGLQAAGAPTRFSNMNVPVLDGDAVRWALLNCHLMRKRFTLVDLLFYIGWWNESFVERILERAEALNSGL